MNDWKNKVVVVTGGSEGLGKEIALAFARKSAHVIVLARNKDRLDSLCASVVQAEPTLKFSGIPTDVTSDESVQNAVRQITVRCERIDVWVNNVGKSTRIQFDECQVLNYQEMMDINFYSAVRCTLAALPELIQTSGHLVNIGSLASRTGWPWMAPYSTSKHALSAFHHQLRLEGPRNVHYLEVCPGPIQRTDGATRYAEVANQLDESAKQPGGGVKLKGIDPVWLAERIERACRKRKPELMVPFYSRAIFALAELFPAWSDRILLWMKK